MKYTADYYVMREFILLRPFRTPAQRVRSHQIMLEWEQTPNGKRIMHMCGKKYEAVILNQTNGS